LSYDSRAELWVLQYPAVADQELNKKIKRKARKKQRRELGDAIEKNGHHAKEQKGKSKRSKGKS
jgi:hypothetical protein